MPTKTKIQELKPQTMRLTDRRSETTNRRISAEARRIYGRALARSMDKRKGEGFRAMNAEVRAIHGDLADASFRTLPPD